MPTIRLATFNVENLFRRVRALNLASWKDSKPILEDYQRFNEIISQPLYSDADKQELVALLVKYRLHLRQESSARFFKLNEVRGKLFSGTRPPKIVAIGRSGWDGWLELKEDDIGSASIENTARVVREVARTFLLWSRRKIGLHCSCSTTKS
jgi:hypothetical protein